MRRSPRARFQWLNKRSAAVDMVARSPLRLARIGTTQQEPHRLHQESPEGPHRTVSSPSVLLPPLLAKAALNVRRWALKATLGLRKVFLVRLASNLR